MVQTESTTDPAIPEAKVVLFLLDRETQRIDQIALQPLRLKAPAVSWTRIVGNRAKWEDLPGEVSSVLANATKLLLDLGLRDSHMRRLAQARVIEIHIPWISESEGWEYRILPWEFILIRALRPYTKGAPGPVIVRCLDRTNPSVALPPLKPVNRALAIISCPTQSNLRASYEKEMNLVGEYFRDRPSLTFTPQSCATFESIDQALHNSTKESIDAIHFLGVEAEGPKRDRSYIWLQHREQESTVCDYEATAQLLTANGTLHPRLVAFSFCHSGPRLAAYTVAFGAHAAIGFQDLVLDDQCQNFFGAFYRTWAETRWEVLAAFERALREVAFTLEGTGIILWLDRSRIGELVPPSLAIPQPQTPPLSSKPELISTLPESFAAKTAGTTVIEANTRPKRPSRSPKSAPSLPPSPPVSLPTPAGIPVSPAPAPVPAPVQSPEPAAASASPSVLSLAELRHQLVVAMSPRKNINYALLHNQQVNGPKPARRTLFEAFSIERPANTSAFDVDVEVCLYAGDHVGYWRERISLKLLTTELAERIHVPLTSVLARSLRESLRTTIETTISVDGKIADHRCHPVSMLAIEEWLDDGICHIWLPSFVLPRDPAVGTVIQRARRCLCALLDDYTAGFDGYQWSLPERVDTQVQAIWATLSLEWQLGYINPPPSFTTQSQRLRRPSVVLEGSAGTCLDLALLFAACLEYVDIDPILILANGHAYVGWWRQEFATDEAPKADGDPGRKPESPNPSQLPGRGTTSWVFGKEAHSAILKAVDDGKLMVLETTGLTRHLAFSEAIREGTKRLRSRLDFECLIDIKRSRSAGITPLPMCL